MFDRNQYIKDYYIVNRDRWLNHYNKRTKILCPVCDHDYLWFDQHLKSKMHKINLELKTKSELIENLLSTDLEINDE